MTGTAEAVALLAATYKDDFSDDRVKAYTGLLDDLDGSAVLNATVLLCKSEKFLPSPAEIRTVVAEQRIGYPDLSLAFVQAQNPERRHPLVDEARRRVGDAWTWKNDSTQDLWFRFREAYKNVTEAAVREIVRGTAPGPTMEALPVSTAMIERPLAARLARQMRGEEVGPVSDLEKADAIRILLEGSPSGRLLTAPDDDPLFVEATRILDEGR